MNTDACDERQEFRPYHTHFFSFQLCFDHSTGYFEIDGCVGVNPTLYLTIGRTYLFDQSDDSNWYHLIGFACK
jgi:hypothetical protein